MKIEKFDTLPSTNQYCELLNLDETEEFTVIVARTQTAGIGQRGNHWEAKPDKNLTFSLVLKPTWLPVADQYQLTKAVSLGIADCLMPLIAEGDRRVRIKWPNDIYVDNNKICGILITHRITNGQIAASVVGIGLNVNQQTFPDWVPHLTTSADGARMGLRQDVREGTGLHCPPIQRVAQQPHRLNGRAISRHVTPTRRGSPI